MTNRTRMCVYIDVFPRSCVGNTRELVIKKNNNKKLYTALSYLGVFTFRTCCKIQICLVCIVASFKLSCV